MFKLVGRGYARLGHGNDWCGIAFPTLFAHRSLQGSPAVDREKRIQKKERLSGRLRTSFGGTYQWAFISVRTLAAPVSNDAAIAVPPITRRGKSTLANEARKIAAMGK